MLINETRGRFPVAQESLTRSILTISKAVVTMLVPRSCTYPVIPPKLSESIKQKHSCR